MPEELGIYAKLVFFNIVIGDLYFNVLIIGLFQISLVMCQILGESIVQKVFVGVLREMWTVGRNWEASEQPGEEVSLGGLEVGGNYICYLVTVVIFMGLGGGKRWEVLKSLYWGGKPQRGAACLGIHEWVWACISIHGHTQPKRYFQ